MWWWLLGWLLGWLSAEHVVAVAAVGQLVVFVFAALYARAQVREARTLRESQALQAQELREAERELRKDEARPYVVVDFERERAPFVNLVIANLGRTMARNVQIEVDPPFDSSVHRGGPVHAGGVQAVRRGHPGAGAWQADRAAVRPDGTGRSWTCR